MEYTKIWKSCCSPIKGNPIEDVFKRVTDCHGSDIQQSNLKAQLRIMSSNMTCDGDVTLNDVMYIQSLSASQRMIITEVCTIVRLILGVPATNAVNERSFSALGRVQSYLRSTMTQVILNHYMICTVHTYRTDAINLDIGNECVSLEKGVPKSWGIS